MELKVELLGISQHKWDFVTAASFRTWRVSQSHVAWGPTKLPKYLYVDKQTPTWINENSSLPPAVNNFLMREVAYKTEFDSIFLYIASRCNIFLDQMQGTGKNCCNTLCFLPYLFFRENQGIGKSTMPTTSLWVDKIHHSYLLGSDFFLNTPFIFLCFLFEKVRVCLQATFG